MTKTEMTEYQTQSLAKVLEEYEPKFFPDDNLTPQIIKDSFMEHLKRHNVFVFPCEADDEIFVVGTGKHAHVKRCTAESFMIDKSFGSVGVNFCCDNNCEGCFFSAWKKDYSEEWSCDNEYGSSCIQFNEFGETAFLSEKEANKVAEKERAKYE